MKRLFVPAIAVLATMLLHASTSLAQSNTLAKLERLEPRELKMTDFELSSKQRVSVEAIGFRDRRERYDALLSSAWILAADTREVVWSLEDANSERMSRHLREYKDDLELSAGRYEVYYATFPFGGDYDRDRDRH